MRQVGDLALASPRILGLTSLPRRCSEMCCKTVEATVLVFGRAPAPLPSNLTSLPRRFLKIVVEKWTSAYLSEHPRCLERCTGEAFFVPTQAWPSCLGIVSTYCPCRPCRLFLCRLCRPYRRLCLHRGHLLMQSDLSCHASGFRRGCLARPSSICEGADAGSRSASRCSLLSCRPGSTSLGAGLYFAN